jgi:quercetin dioxygenase-like cupin family protein
LPPENRSGAQQQRRNAMSRAATFSAALCLGAVLIALASAQEPLRVVPTDAVKYISHPLFRGAQLANVVGDPSKPEMIVQRFKFPPDFNVAPHTHTYSEVATVLSGTLNLGEGTTFDTGRGRVLPAGSVFALQAGHPHYVWTTSEETVVQIIYSGPSGIAFSNPADDPRKK